MLTVENKTYRNLQEQVYKNAQDIQDLVTTGGVLNEFGIKVVDQVNSISNLPSVQNYIQSQAVLGRELDELYGDAIAVGTTTPYTLYIFTRAFSGTEEPEWFNIGQFPVPGPQGQQGIQGPVGPQGTRGSTWTILPNDPTSVSGYKVGDSFLNSATGDVYYFNGNSWIRQGNIRGQQGIQGIQGIQGPVGPQGPIGVQGPIGPAGQSFQVAGILSNTNQLPTPSESIRSQAYLVGNETDGFDLYIITGYGSSLLWFNAGSVTGVEGPQGPQGIQGIQGQPGKDGKDGDTITDIQAGNVNYQESQTITPITVTLSDNRRFTFNVVAQRGPQGLQGPQGIRGEAGPRGQQGIQGPMGPAGVVDYSNIYTKEEIDEKDETLQASLMNELSNSVITLQANIDGVSNALTTTQNDLNTDKQNLANNYYNKTEVNGLIANVNQFKIEFVDQLPTVGNTLTIYFVSVSGQTDAYDEYMYINGVWEQIGTTRVDLTPYYTSAQVDNIIQTNVQQLTTQINSKASQTSVDSLQNDVEAIEGREPYVINVLVSGHQILTTDQEVEEAGNGERLIIVKPANNMITHFVVGVKNILQGLDTLTVSLNGDKVVYILLSVKTSVTSGDKYWCPIVLRPDGQLISKAFDNLSDLTFPMFNFDTVKTGAEDQFRDYNLGQLIPYNFTYQGKFNYGYSDPSNHNYHKFESFPTYINNTTTSSTSYEIDFNKERLTGIFNVGGISSSAGITRTFINGPSGLSSEVQLQPFKLVNYTSRVVDMDPYQSEGLRNYDIQMLFINNSIYYRFGTGSWIKVATGNGGGGGGSSITLEDSDTIKVNETGTGTQLVLATDVVNNITRSLKAPVANVTQLELVGIEANSTEQTMRAIGGSNSIQVNDDGEKLTIDIKAGTVGSWQPEIANVKLLPIFASQLGGLCGAVQDTVILKTTSDISISKEGSSTAIDSGNQILGLTYVYDKNTRITTISNLRCASSNGMSVQFITGASCTNNEVQTKFKGDDCSNNVFTPQANTVYEVYIWGQKTGVGGTIKYTGIVMNKGAY